MRPRFSLRWLFIGTTLFTVVLYRSLYSPTVIAERFVDSINDGELSELKSVRYNGKSVLDILKCFQPRYTYEEASYIGAEIRPLAQRERLYRIQRQIGERYRLQRTVWVYFSFPEGDIELQFVSHPFGVSLVGVSSNTVTTDGFELPQ